MPAPATARPPAPSHVERSALRSVGIPTLATRVVILALVLGQASAAATQAAPTLRVAVASNFRATVEDLSADYTADTGVPVTISSAASGVLAAQILRGAPFDLFFAADRDRADAVAQAGHAAGPPVCYARGRLVLLGADDLEAALADPGRSIAIANPRSAPYGAAALTVLAREGFASADQRRILRGTNVQQALQFFESSGADLALVARSLVGARGVTVPGAWHPPIDQYAVVVDRGVPAGAAEDFLATLRTDQGQRILQSHGYETCP